MLTATQMKQDCCGCMACSFSCPKSAISMKEDECGFLYPEINHELCVHCNLCTKVCPLQNTYTGADAVPDIYALQNHQKAIVSESSSGGMFSLLADWTLAQGGVIYGVSFDEGFQVRHMRADSAEKAAAFRTSKYVQSDPSHIYQTICDDLANGLTVLLTGTPCQIAGVARFLEIKHADTTSLYTCDNICHGVPSPGVWKDYLEILKSKYMDTDAQITSINMRICCLYLKNFPLTKYSSVFSQSVHPASIAITQAIKGRQILPWEISGMWTARASNLMLPVV